MLTSSAPGRDLASGVVLTVVAAGYLAAGRRYSLETLAAPGPGLFPLLAGAFLLILAVTQIGIGLARLRRHRAADGRHAGDIAEPRAGRGRLPDDGRVPRRAAAGAALLIAYAAGLPVVGFFPAGFALVLLSSRLLGAPGWWRPAILAAGVTLAAYAVFALWLRVPLPAGSAW